MFPTPLTAVTKLLLLWSLPVQLKTKQEVTSLLRIGAKQLSEKKKIDRGTEQRGWCMERGSCLCFVLIQWLWLRHPTLWSCLRPNRQIKISTFSYLSAQPHMVLISCFSLARPSTPTNQYIFKNLRAKYSWIRLLTSAVAGWVFAQLVFLLLFFPNMGFKKLFFQTL